MHYDDEPKEDEQSNLPDPVIDANDIGEDGKRIGEGKDSVEKDVL